MGTYLQLDHLSVGYNTVPVIEDINLDIQKGEVIALIGLAIKKHMTKVMPTTIAATCTLLQFIPEKLPLDQLCRLTISESAANVTTKSVIAEQI